MDQEALPDPSSGRNTRASSVTSSLEQLYDRLSRFQWWLRPRRRTGTGLEMHKRLRDAGGTSGPGAGTAPLNDWLFDLVEFGEKPRVLDIGCGFGATMFAWAARASGAYFGLTLSGYQAQKAVRESKRNGLQPFCSFRKQSFDDPLPDRGQFDVVVSVETLLHSPDLRKTLRHLASSVRPGGSIVLVEDMAVSDGVRNRESARSLLDGWCTETLHTVSDYESALEESGFDLDRTFDLTSQVEFCDEETRVRRERRLRWLRRVWPGRRGVLDVFLGGIAMERLYVEGSLTYRAMLATRGTTP